MKKKALFFNNKSILVILFISILFFLILLGFAFPKGISGIKPLKTVTYIAQYITYDFQFTESSNPLKFFKWFVFILAILTIIYFILNPSRAVAYLLAILILLSIFLIIPAIVKFLENIENPAKTNFAYKLKNQNIEDTKQNEQQVEVLPYQQKENEKGYKTLYIFLFIFLSAFTLFVVIIFLVNLIKRIILEIKEGKFGFNFFKNRSKKVLINEVQSAINDAIDLIDTKNNVKDAIINCYLALLYSVKKYTKKVKDPSLTCREFEPVLLSLDLAFEDIEVLTYSFEKAKYSNKTILEMEKEKVLASLKNCIIKLKMDYKIDKN